MTTPKNKQILIKNDALLPKVAAIDKGVQTGDSKRYKKSVHLQIFMSIVANFTILSSGMVLGFPAISLHSLQNSENAAFLNDSQGSWFASINMLTSPMGALLYGYILDRYGRKFTMIVINILSIISWTVMALASDTDSKSLYTQVLISRLIQGIVTGLSSGCAAVYAAEIAFAQLRGRLIVCTSFAIALGIVIIYQLGYFYKDNFRIISWFACGICIFAMFSLILIPESPSWLAMKGKIAKAEKAFKNVRGYTSKSPNDMNEISKEIQILLSQQNSKLEHENETVIQKLCRPEVFKPLLIMIGFFAFQQFSGIFVIVVYAIRFLKETGVTIDPFLGAVIVGVVRILGHTSVLYILDRFGRKPPAIYGGIGMGICMMGLALLSGFKLQSSWAPMVLILVFIFTSTIGYLTLPFAMIAEVFPQNVRGFASGLCVCSCYTMSFCVVKFYPTMVEMLGTAYVLGFYAIISFIGVIFVIVFLPETNGKTLEEIENSFKNKPKDIYMKKLTTNA